MTWRIDLDVLALLVAVAEEGSLGRGAARTGFQQPNASRAISELEKAVGVVLLVRTPRGSRTTREGGLLVEWARPLLAQASTFSEALDSLGERDAGPVEVAASMTIAEHLVPLWLARLRASDPATSVRLRVENSADVVALVRSGAVEVGFIEDGSSPVGLAQRVVAHDRLLLVVSRDHAWARRRDPVTVDELA
ncbi:MAG TPA: LysR substrate-binding domain-containing protein, partial [Propionibacteriaceae bacterium]|nr:LysR substrate-binding domain-containing protein [Propionibacteriaceae bacterium]